MEYWKDTELAKLYSEANRTLFDLHRYIEKSLESEDWRVVYKMRCDLGFMQQNHSIQTGFKDGVKS